MRVRSEFVVTTAYSRLAGGAGGIAIIRHAGGVSLVDAGVQMMAGGGPDAAMADAAMAQLEALVPERAFTDMVNTHAHADHLNLLPRLAAEGYTIGTIRITALQAAQPSFERFFGEMMDAYERTARTDVEAQRSQWEALQPSESLIDTEATERAWEAWRDAEISRRVEGMQPRVELLYQGPGGTLEVTNAEVVVSDGRRSTRLPAGTEVGTQPVEGAHVDPVTGRRTVLHPEAGDPSTTVRGSKVDTYSANHIIELPNGERLIVASDVRAQDFDPRGEQSLLRNFETALSNLGHTAQFQVWEFTHHMQAGGFRVTNSAQLPALTRMLAQFSNVTNQSGAPAGNALVVSVKPELVKPGNVWLLRALGFEVFLATEGNPIQILDVVMRSGESVTGLVGEATGEGYISRAHLLQGELVLAELETRIADAERGMEVGSADVESVNRLNEMELERNTLRDALRDYRSALLGDSGPLDPSRIIGPLEATQEPFEVERQAIEDSLVRIRESYSIEATGEGGHVQRFGRPVLAVLGRDVPVDSTTRRVIDARNQVDSFQSRIEAGEVPAGTRHELRIAMEEYRSALQEVLEGLDTKDTSRRSVIEAEITRMGHVITQLESQSRTLPHHETTAEGLRRVLPTSV